MTSDVLATHRFPRRALLALPFAAGAVALLWPRKTAVPNAAQNGTGPEVLLTLFSDSGQMKGTQRVRSVVLSDEEWRRMLTPTAFAITRRGATEFAFANPYWNNHKSGLYRCVCCGNALFRSQDKFDSDTGWPSFSAPCAKTNIYTASDFSYSMKRTEVRCRKCNGHLGHVFNDGPPPSMLRYCVNSGALRFT